MAGLPTLATNAKEIADYLAAQAAAAQTPVPTPTPTPTPAPVDPFAGGSKYLPLPTATIVTSEVLPGDTKVNALIRLDHPSPATVVGRIRCFNGNGGKAKPDKIVPFFFHQEDPLEQVISFDIYPMKEGQSVKLEMPNVPDGAHRGAGAEIFARAGATPQPFISWTGRVPIQFEPLGAKVYEATGREVLQGGLWLDRFAHGRTQPGNGETGYYSPDALVLDGDTLLLQARKLDVPISVGTPATIYPYAAACLTGLMDDNPGHPVHARPDLCFREGSIKIRARMPSRIGTWYGLWLCSVLGGYPQWPFEIDFAEGKVTSDWKKNNQMTFALHGGKQGSASSARTLLSMQRLMMSDYGLKPTEDTEAHDYFCTVNHDWITAFVDSKETVKAVNPFPGALWYPLIDNAVFAPADVAFIDGDPSLAVESVTIWRAT
jgi:hypothetical protein